MLLLFIFQVEDLSKESQVERELMLIKLNADYSTKGEVCGRFPFLFVYLFHIGRPLILSSMKDLMVQSTAFRACL